MDHQPCSTNDMNSPKCSTNDMNSPKVTGVRQQMRGRQGISSILHLQHVHPLHVHTSCSTHTITKD